MRFVSHDSEATLALAEHVGRGLRAGEVLALSGDLGSGKTTFVRGLARGMGITDPVSSPTYTLMHAYEGTGLELFHFDAWMEGRQKSLLADGGSGVLETGGVAVVEWASR
ncbi:MAG TPA: tRNA (adenosine(37)-N6)-threonylcarbamoyltransferase complex ATPase subunit type 1 TsaE, partial [Planctomycetota bacterium]|nr:tRNA (adenosine(37)-N6)-threonylcarbamoyltransferase complex ATPase subunit type 1 TsaE [Planctomycetota bacterium]